MSNTLKQKHKELLEQAQALLDKAQEMESLIKEEEDIPVDENIFGLVKEQDIEGGTVFYLEQDTEGNWDYFDTEGGTYYPTFKTKESAKAWSNVIEVMLLLRCQEGVIVPQEDVCIITLSDGKLVIENLGGYFYYNGAISPSFSSIEYAQKAIDNIGEERIIKAIKTLEGIKQ